MIKSQANIATRHDILVYFFQANVVGNVATSSPMANRGHPEHPRSTLGRVPVVGRIRMNFGCMCGR